MRGKHTAEAGKSGIDREDLLVAVGLLLVLPVLFFLLMDRQVNLYDGGMPLSMAVRVIQGQVQHRDFYFQYGPMQPVVFALLMRLFGPTLFYIACLQMVIKAVTVACGYFAVRAVASRWAAVWVAVCSTVTLASLNFLSSGTDAIATVLAFGAIAGFVFRGPLSARRNLCLVLIAGITSLYRYEQGPLLLGVYLLVLCIASFLWPSSGERHLRTVVVSFGFVLLGYTVIVLPLMLYFWHAGALPDLIYQCFTFVREHYRAGRSTPFPELTFRAPEDFIIYVPFAAPPVALAYVAWSVWRNKRHVASARFGILTMFALLTIPFAMKASVRVDFGQMTPALLPALIVIAVLMDRTVPLQSRILAFLLCMTATFSLYRLTMHDRAGHGILKARFETGGAAVQHLPWFRHATAAEETWCNTQSPMTRTYCFLMDSDHQKAVELLHPRLHPGDWFYSGAPQHQIMVAGDNLMYFATNTVPAVKWANFDVDLQNRADIQTSMVADLEKRRPQYISEYAGFGFGGEPNDSSISSHVQILDDYLHRTYQPMAAYGLVTVLQRRSAAIETNPPRP